MTRGAVAGGLAASAPVGMLLAGCTGPFSLADKFRPLTSGRNSSQTAFAACKTWLSNGGPAGEEFRLVGAEMSTLAKAKAIGDDAGAHTASDPNYVNYPGTSSVAVCALTGPMAKEGLKGNVLVYYVVLNSPSNGILANFDDPSFKEP